MKLILFVTLCVILGVNSSPFAAEGEQEISPYIINGVRSAVAPYFVFVQYFNAQNLGFFGGGALISNRHIVTAATNVQGFARLSVHMGSANRSAMISPPIISPATVHPNYVPLTRANDIAIIRLVTAIIPRAEISPILLPPITTPPLVLPLENEEGQINGFGFQTVGSNGPSQFLYRSYKRMIGNARCTAFFLLNTETGFCAEDAAERSSACQGDIGNPFVVSYRRNDVLMGIVSMHPPCGQMSPTAFTRVTAFRTWLDQQLAI